MLSVTGTLSDAGSATIGATGTLQASAGGTLLLSSLAMSGGTLAAVTNGTIAIGTSLSGAAANVVTVQAGAKIAGSGAIDGAYIADSGRIAAQGGTLDLQTTVVGTGSAVIGAGATLEASGALDASSITFASGGGGTLLLGAPAEVGGAISGFKAGDLIDLKNLIATSLTFMSHTLTLENGTTTVATLTFAGNYTSANFTLSSDHNGGTDIGYSTGAAIAQDFAPADFVEPTLHAVDSAMTAGWGEFSGAYGYASVLLALHLERFAHA